jgi:hypothetical protein
MNAALYTVDGHLLTVRRIEKMLAKLNACTNANVSFVVWKLYVLLAFVVRYTRFSNAAFRLHCKRAGFHTVYPMKFDIASVPASSRAAKSIYLQSIRRLELFKSAHDKLSHIKIRHFPAGKTQYGQKCIAELQTLIALLDESVELLGDIVFAIEGVGGPDKDEISKLDASISALLQKNRQEKRACP